MSVVIKMDMPKSCGMCECSGTGVCREWMKVDRRDMGSKRADTCPILCELPEKHGRLIDENEILKPFNECLERGESLDKWRTNYGGFKNIISNPPTIIEAEGENG